MSDATAGETSITMSPGSFTLFSSSFVRASMMVSRMFEAVAAEFSTVDPASPYSE